MVVTGAPAGRVSQGEASVARCARLSPGPLDQPRTLAVRGLSASQTSGTSAPLRPRPRDDQEHGQRHRWMQLYLEENGRRKWTICHPFAKLDAHL